MPTLYCTALYDYVRPDESGLSFSKGQIIQVHNQLESGWWDGVCNGERGWFPSNYVSEAEEMVETPSSLASEPISAISATWVRQVGPDGRIFYRNRITNETSNEASDNTGRSSMDGSQDSPHPRDAASYSSSISSSSPKPSFGSVPLTPPASASVLTPGVDGAMNMPSSFFNAQYQARLPPNWTIFTQDNGTIVYYNTLTKEIRWTPPVNIPQQPYPTSHSMLPDAAVLSGSPGHPHQSPHHHIAHFHARKLSSSGIHQTPTMTVVGGQGAPIEDATFLAQQSATPLSMAIVQDTGAAGVQRNLSSSSSNSNGWAQPQRPTSSQAVPIPVQGSSGGYPTPQGQRRLAPKESMESIISKREQVNEGLPKNWGRKTTMEGRVYYYNMLTNETVWELSEIMQEPDKRQSIIESNASLADEIAADRMSLASIAEEPNTFSWGKVTMDIVKSVQQLNESALKQAKAKFVPQSTAIVESIRVMLIASGAAGGKERRTRSRSPRTRKPSGESTEGETTPTSASPNTESSTVKALRPHHKTIMAALSKLVLAAKVASGVWPPPDAIAKLQAAAAEILHAVRAFVTAAQEAGLTLTAPPKRMSRARRESVFDGKKEDDTQTGSTADEDSVSSNGAQTPTADRSKNDGETPSPNPSPFPAKMRRSFQQHQQIHSYSETVQELESTTIRVVQKLGEITCLLKDDTGSSPAPPMPDGKFRRVMSMETSSKLIAEVRKVVTDVGTFLSTVDEFPMESLRDQITVEFKVNRGTLYNAISGLVMATSNATTSQLTSAYAVDDIMQCIMGVEKGIQDLMISTKLLLEDLEEIEHQSLQSMIHSGQHIVDNRNKRSSMAAMPASATATAAALAVGVPPPPPGVANSVMSIRSIATDRSSISGHSQRSGKDSLDPEDLTMDDVSSIASSGLRPPTRLPLSASLPTPGTPSTSVLSPMSGSTLDVPGSPSSPTGNRMMRQINTAATHARSNSSTSSMKKKNKLLNILGSDPMAENAILHRIATQPSYLTSPSPSSSNDSSPNASPSSQSVPASLQYANGPTGPMPPLPSSSSASASTSFQSSLDYDPRRESSVKSPSILPSASTHSSSSNFSDYSFTPQLVGDAWYLKYDYSPQEIMYNMEGQVKGGRLDSLVERLTLHDYYDSAFMQTFLLTYRSFTTSSILFRLLERRFVIQPPQGLSTEEMSDWVKRKRTPIQLRVFNVMKSWIESYCTDDPEDLEVLQAMKRFAETTMVEIGSPTATQLQKLVERREKKGSGSNLRKMILTSGREVPPPILPRNLRRIKLLDIDPLEVTRQLTIIEARAYNQLQPVEFLNQAWSKKDNNVAVNVRGMAKTSNRISGWIAKTILSETDNKKRLNIIKHFINIADKCRQLNNFNTLISVIAGLDLAPVHRLQRTWAVLPQKSQQILDHLRTTMNPAKNFSRYREALHTINPPCVPFLGFYLTDLTFIEDGSPDFVKGSSPGMINFAKRMKTAEVILEIQQYQNIPYFLTPVPELQDFLQQCLNEADVDENTLYDMSLAIEPREREEEKIVRLLAETGFF
ncbi:hypothetical protein HDU97_000044 [Phlyctochytrium planicorne]|nr:hypothetical protein HDU97_000044 [Phlyctochytrium planicorne]